MALGWRVCAAIYRLGQSLASDQKGLPVSPFFAPPISTFMPPRFVLPTLIARDLVPAHWTKLSSGGGFCYQFVLKSPNILEPDEIQHVDAGGHTMFTIKS
jgi:hypothetical protein